jgi:hypothetical protein
MSITVYCRVAELARQDTSPAVRGLWQALTRHGGVQILVERETLSLRQLKRRV